MTVYNYDPRFKFYNGRVVTWVTKQVSSYINIWGRKHNIPLPVTKQGDRYVSVWTKLN